MEYHKIVGSLIKEMKDSKGWSANRLARELSIQIYKNLPYNDRPEFFRPNDPLNQNDPLSNLDSDSTLHKDITDYIENKYNLKTRLFKFDGNERMLDYAISENSINDYLSGRTPITTLVFISFCQLFEMSSDVFIREIEKRLFLNKNHNKTTENTINLTLEQAYTTFCKNIFGIQTDNRYVFDIKEQRHLFSALLLDGKKEASYYFTYLPRTLGLRDLTDPDKKIVIYQRGILNFVMRDGMCHVTSKLKVSSQGIPTEYRGFAILMNPNSNGPSCTCFLKEINNAFGIFIIFTFRLSSLDKNPKRQTRISECMAVRKVDGTSYVYRLLLSKNYITDEEMKYFVGHLKLGTSENTYDGKELNIVIKEKYIDIAKNYFENVTLNGVTNEKAVYSDLKNYFGETNKEKYLDIIRMIEKSIDMNKENVCTINPSIFNVQNKYHMLFLGWLGKYGLSARHDRVEKIVDDRVEDIHKTLYPELHTIDEIENNMIPF